MSRIQLDLQLSRSIPEILFLALLLIPVQQIIILTPQRVFQSASDHLPDEDQTIISYSPFDD